MKKPKIILGIETSCDETAAAVVQKDQSGVKILSNVVATSIDIQTKYGGIVPEQAAREQIASIIPVIDEAIKQARCTPDNIDAIAVTEGPGLIGSLLVGVETAKSLSLVWQKPLVPINHLTGHFYANWINSGEQNSPTFPSIGLLISGGHTDLVLFKGHGKYEYLGGTRDDAAGECFDKCARLLGLPYPGGSAISKLAEEGDPKAFKLPRPMLDSKDFDFSFSGLKTAVLNLVQELTSNNRLLTISHKQNLSASIQEAIADVLSEKTIAAAQYNHVEHIMVAGGVAANKVISTKIKQLASEKLEKATVLIPPPKLCTDNGAYIAAAAFYNFHPIDPLKLQANPNLSLNQ